MFTREEIRKDLSFMNDVEIRALAEDLYLDLLNRYADALEFTRDIQEKLVNATTGKAEKMKLLLQSITTPQPGQNPRQEVKISRLDPSGRLTDEDVKALVGKIQEALLKQAKRSRRPGPEPNGS